jgi:DNA-binding CsgD family transcriptional regulator
MAQIKQLCCLGLGPKAVVPRLARLLPQLVSGLSVTFFFTDARGRLVDIYDENPATPEIAPLYMSEFYNRRESEVTISIEDVFRRGLVGLTFDQLLKVDRRTWERSDMYNLILRPIDYCDGLQLAVRERGCPLGVVKVSRGAGAPEFAQRDLDLLIALEPYLAHAFVSSHEATCFVDSDADEDEGLIITDRDGRLRHLSAQARILLFYAAQSEAGWATRGASELPTKVTRLARNLAQTFQGKTPSSPPVHVHENAWGQFVFRANWLDSVDATAPLVGIRVTRREPLPVRLLRRIEQLPLSERQVEVSLHLASGLTYAAIAERLGLSRSTVIFHVQEVFNKLGVASRAELQAKLMAL